MTLRSSRAAILFVVALGVTQAGCSSHDHPAGDGSVGPDAGDAAVPSDAQTDDGGAPQTCANGVRDGDETGIDCGGSCPNADCCESGHADPDLGSSWLRGAWYSARQFARSPTLGGPL